MPPAALMKTTDQYVMTAHFRGAVISGTPRKSRLAALRRRRSLPRCGRCGESDRVRGDLLFFAEERAQQIARRGGGAALPRRDLALHFREPRIDGRGGAKALEELIADLGPPDCGRIAAVRHTPRYSAGSASGLA